ncbi:MAG: hypothetical protein HY664_05795 [Chloroflexi bacterium]|nr:hypothetical protein [Chloroflexota bacterium]
MASYKVYGKWYHLEYSDYFEEVVDARSSREAVFKAAKWLSEVERAAEIQWVSNKPTAVQLGRLDPEPEFWVGDDQIYQIKTVTKLEPGEVECPKCRGVGKIQGYVEVEQGAF